jgi:hypothetical protein
VVLCERVPVAGAVAVKVAVNVSVYVPLLAFLEVTAVTWVTVPFTATEFGRAQVVFDAVGEAVQDRARV